MDFGVYYFWRRISLTNAEMQSKCAACSLLVSLAISHLALLIRDHPVQLENETENDKRGQFGVK